jgi:hypothetical protein
MQWIAITERLSHAGPRDGAARRGGARGEPRREERPKRTSCAARRWVRWRSRRTRPPLGSWIGLGASLKRSRCSEGRRCGSSQTIAARSSGVSLSHCPLLCLMGYLELKQPFGGVKSPAPSHGSIWLRHRSRQSRVGWSPRILALHTADTHPQHRLRMRINRQRAHPRIVQAHARPCTPPGTAIRGRSLTSAAAAPQARWPRDP